jgi:hypothetical protein
LMFGFKIIQHCGVGDGQGGGYEEGDGEREEGGGAA